MNQNHNCRHEHLREHRCQNGCFQRGPSSFHMQDPNIVFEKMALKKGDAFLDLGCGAGDYSICAAKIVGNTGNVYALDLYQNLLDNVCEEATKQGINNIHPVVSDIRRQIDILDSSINTCLIATVLHTIDFPTENARLFSEIRRVLKPNGKLAVLECKKEDSMFGPPMSRRISPEELEKALGKYGFSKVSYTDLGTNYFALFILSR